MAKTQGLYSQERDKITGLTKGQSQVLRLMTEEKKTQTEVAAVMGVSRQRVRQIVTDLLDKGYTVPGARTPTKTTLDGV